MIYYRVAFRVEQTCVMAQSAHPVQVGVWKWRSTILTSPHALFTLLRTYTSIPKEHIRIFFTASEDAMDEMLSRQNMGLISSSLTVEQFLVGKSINGQDMRRLAYELSTAEDHDREYTFTPSAYLPERLAWMKLLAKVQRGELVP